MIYNAHLMIIALFTLEIRVNQAGYFDKRH